MPFLLCNPVEKNGEPIWNPAGHLICYEIKGPKLAKSERPSVSVQVVDQFGTLKGTCHDPNG